MKLRKLNREEHRKTRKLWEKIFYEDSESFLDYYYDIKTKENDILVMEEQGEIIAMLHLNPYKMKINNKICPTNYIVAVATDVRYRSRGIMGALLKKAMQVMHDRKEPFTFLMPAAEAIYYPYDFRYVYSRNQGRITGRNMRYEDIIIQNVEEKDCEEIAVFANQRLERYGVTTSRDKMYYQTLIAEQRSEAGQVVMIRRGEQLRGIFCYARGEAIEIREPLFYEESDFLHAIYLLKGNETEEVKCIGYGDEKQPIIMARIIHLESFLKNIPIIENTDMFIRVEDKFIAENNGVFHLVGTKENGIIKVEKCNDYSGVCKKVTIAELTTEIFGKYFPEVFLNEVV